MKRKILSGMVGGALFYIGWAICLWGVANQMAWLGVLCIGAILIGHFFLSKHRARDALVVVFSVLAGTLLDSALQGYGLIVYLHPYVTMPWLAPLWITSLYALLAINIDYSLGWLHGRPFLAATLGAAGAIVSYLAGVRIGAATFTSDATVYFIAVVWLVFFPLLYIVSDYCQRWFSHTNNAHDEG